MSALAHILAKRHLPVSGSDLRSSAITAGLQGLGVHLFHQQQGENLNWFRGEGDQVLPQVVCSTAINPKNDEFQAAQALGCPIFHRSDLLAALMAEPQTQSVAIAGTHGKTTTSSLLAYVLLEVGLDPTIIVGGEVSAWGGNARLGEGPYLVAEADESDGSLVKLRAAIGAITNIELDHPDHYANLDQLIHTFQTFAAQCGVVVGCGDCAVIRQHLKPEITYGLEPAHHPDYLATEVLCDGEGTTAQVWERGECLGSLRVKLLGRHNLGNALAVVAIARHLGVEFEAIAQAIATFSGAKRRFEHRGSYNHITLIDDYAHHPSEILVTLAAAKLQAQQNRQRVVAIFQAHRYSRAASLLNEFASCFRDADQVIVTDIYSAGEQNNQGITGEKLSIAISQHHPQVLYHGELGTLPEYLYQHLQPQDLVLFLGAGNLNQTIPTLLAMAQPGASPPVPG